MEFNIPDEELRRLASDASFTGGYSKAIVEMFRQTLQILDAAPNESVLPELKCLKYRKMRGRGSRRRLALTKEADLIVRFQNRKPKSVVVVEEICCNGRKNK